MKCEPRLIKICFQFQIPHTSLAAAQQFNTKDSTLVALASLIRAFSRPSNFQIQFRSSRFHSSHSFKRHTWNKYLNYKLKLRIKLNKKQSAYKAKRENHFIGDSRKIQCRHSSWKGSRLRKSRYVGGKLFKRNFPHFLHGSEKIFE